MPIIDLNGLNHFLTKVKELITESVTSSKPTNSEFAQKCVESQPDMIYTAVSDDGVTYTLTVPGVESLYTGLSLMVLFERSSATTAPSLNLNGLGAKSVRRRLSNISTSPQQGYSSNWLYKNKPFRLLYDGSYWIVDGLPKPSVSDLYGTVSIAKGGTGATTAEEALENLGAASTEYVDSRYAELLARIEALETNS